MTKKTLLRFLPLMLIALTLACALSVGALVSDLLAPSDAEGYSFVTEDAEDTSAQPEGWAANWLAECNAEPVWNTSAE